MSAASQARRLRGPDDLEIVAFERGDYTSYSACGIPYLIGGVVTNIASLIVREPRVFMEEQSIDVRIRHDVVAIDLDKRAVRVRSEDGGEGWEGFDDLLIATGGVPRRPPLANSTARGIFGVQTLNDGLAVRAFLERLEPTKAVIVGGGYIGLEMAEALLSKGLDVTLIEQRSQPMPTLDPDMGALIQESLTEMGIHVHTNETVTAFEASGGAVSGVVTTRKGTLPANIVVLGLGSAPNSDLASDARVPLGPSGAIAVDPHMRTQAEGVWAAGDCAEKFHRVSRRGVSIALGTHANKEGRVAGTNLGGGDATFPGVLGTATVKVCGLELARTGLNEAEASDAGFGYLTTTVDSTTRAGYYPGAAEIKTKLVVERGSGRLLGGQIIGREGAAKRIDVIATALWNGMSVGEMWNLDLSYAPPFSPVWDPVVITARKAADLVETEKDPGGGS
jgi:NADPH-dependent 2,4-dienoyl-CoA reductase/sulfur reductase-like enzyme